MYSITRAILGVYMCVDYVVRHCVYMSILPYCMCIHHIHIYIYIPSGGKPRQCFERFEKNVVPAKAKLLIHSPKYD